MPEVLNFNSGDCGRDSVEFLCRPDDFTVVNVVDAAEMAFRALFLSDLGTGAAFQSFRFKDAGCGIRLVWVHAEFRNGMSPDREDLLFISRRDMHQSRVMSNNQAALPDEGSGLVDIVFSHSIQDMISGLVLNLPSEFGFFITSQQYNRHIEVSDDVNHLVCGHLFGAMLGAGHKCNVTVPERHRKTGNWHFIIFRNKMIQSPAVVPDIKETESFKIPVHNVFIGKPVDLEPYHQQFPEIDFIHGKRHDTHPGFNPLAAKAPVQIDDVIIPFDLQLLDQLMQIIFQYMDFINIWICL